MPVGLPLRIYRVSYWLKKLNYNGWYSLDLYPYRDDATEACNASIEFIKKESSFDTRPLI